MGAAISWFVREGYTVCIPLTDSQNYDLIVDKGQPLRVQVRTSRHLAPSGGYSFSMTVKGGNQSWNRIVKRCAEAADIDAFFFVCGSGEMYLIPRSKLLGIRHTVVLGGVKYREYRVSQLEPFLYDCRPSAN